MDRTAPLPKKVAAVERWLLGEFRLYTQQPTRTKATSKISGPTKLLETWELKKKNEGNKERKDERKKNFKNKPNGIFRDRGIFGGSFICREVMTSQKLNLLNYGIGRQIHKEQDEIFTLAKNQPFGANWWEDINSIMLQ